MITLRRGTGPDGNLFGAVFMIAAMTGFAIEDALFKSVTRSLQPGLALVLFGLSGLAVFTALSWRAGEPILHHAMRRPRLLLRSLSEIAGRLFFALALAFAPLSVTAAILQATPLVVTAGAAIVFAERVGVRRWVGMGAGLAGVMMVLRPLPGDFDTTALFALAAMFGFAGRDLATRASPPTLSARHLGTLGFLVVTVSGLILTGWDAGPARLPTANEALRLGLTGGIGAAAYAALTVAMRNGEVSVVTPFRYSRLLVALFFAVLVFGERPNGWTLAGVGLIVAAGVFGLRTGREERVRARRPASATTAAHEAGQPQDKPR